MSGYKLTPLAEQDYYNILDFTLEKWDYPQYKKYRDILRNAFARIAKMPLLGKHREELPPQYYSYHVGRHMIFYRVAEEGIEIVRILHDRMDFKRYLSGDEES